MSQQMFHESREDGRSVLGMLAVQVERDPKTGATVVRSVAPVSTPAGAPNTTTVFDDGRKSIHALGGSVGQPSTEELGQILSAIDGVGMKVLLDEVAVTPSTQGTKAQDEKSSGVGDQIILPLSSPGDTPKASNAWVDDSRSNHTEAVGQCTTMVVRDTAEQVDHIEDQRLEEGPVTLMFLGYTDSLGGEGDAQEDQGGLITVERVMITEDGEEHILGPQTSVSVHSPEQEVGGKSQDFQIVDLGENGEGAKVQQGDGDKSPQVPPLPTAAEGDAKAKRKTCQCCSVIVRNSESRLLEKDLEPAARQRVHHGA